MSGSTGDALGASCISAASAASLSASLSSFSNAVGPGLEGGFKSITGSPLSPGQTSTTTGSPGAPTPTAPRSASAAAASGAAAPVSNFDMRAASAAATAAATVPPPSSGEGEGSRHRQRSVTQAGDVDAILAEIIDLTDSPVTGPQPPPQGQQQQQLLPGAEIAMDAVADSAAAAAAAPSRAAAVGAQQAQPALSPVREVPGLSASATDVFPTTGSLNPGASASAWTVGLGGIAGSSTFGLSPMNLTATPATLGMGHDSITSAAGVNLHRTFPPPGEGKKRGAAKRAAAAAAAAEEEEAEEEEEVEAEAEENTGAAVPAAAAAAAAADSAATAAGGEAESAAALCLEALSLQAAGALGALPASGQQQEPAEWQAAVASLRAHAGALPPLFSLQPVAAAYPELAAVALPVDSDSAGEVREAGWRELARCVQAYAAEHASAAAPCDPFAVHAPPADVDVNVRAIVDAASALDEDSESDDESVTEEIVGAPVPARAAPEIPVVRLQAPVTLKTYLTAYHVLLKVERSQVLMRGGDRSMRDILVSTAEKLGSILAQAVSSA